MILNTNTAFNPLYAPSEELGQTPMEALKAIPPQPVVLTGTLLASGWTGGVQTVTVSGMSDGSKGSIGLPGSATKAQREMARAAQLALTAQAANSVTITADGTVPTINIPFSILVVG